MSSKRQFCFQHIEAWRKSQMAQAEYARQHNLSIKSFGYYRRLEKTGLLLTQTTPSACPGES